MCEAARQAGASGANRSGAGPCLIAYTMEQSSCQEAVGKAMQQAFERHGVSSRILVLGLDSRGAHILNH